MKQPLLKRTDLVYPELSYQIVGILYNVYDSIGHGYNESVYQKAVAVACANASLKFQEQVYFPIMFQDKRIGSGYLDFLIEDKVVLELKRGDRFVKAHIGQVYQYLLANKLQLGILAYFAPRTIHFKRILNIPEFVHS